MHDDPDTRGLIRFRRRWRSVGWMFFALGSLLTIAGLLQIADPDAQILFNGVHTTARGPKIVFTVFSAAFAVFGIGALTLPERYVGHSRNWLASLRSSK